MKLAQFLSAGLILLACSGCGLQPAGHAQVAVAAANLPAAACTPTDQDPYVYRPARLQFLQTCVRAAGTVMDIAQAPGDDGDIDFQVRLDPSYQSLLTTGNQDLGGNLQVEAVCQNIPPVIVAMRVCASDPDPFLGPFPHVGEHIWVEGRYVLDLGHSAWAELHPLYRWGAANP